MDLVRTEASLEDCRAFLATTPEGSPIAAYLTRYLAVILCSEVEQTVQSLVLERVERSNDAEVVALVRRLTKTLVKNVTHKETRRVLEHFEGDRERRYDEVMRTQLRSRGADIDAALQSLANLVELRDQVAHRAPPNVTFGELENAFLVAKDLVAAVRESLV